MAKQPASERQFDVSLGLGYNTRVCVWKNADSAPTRHSFAIEGYFDPACRHSKRIGTIHLGLDYLNVETVIHEAYHAIDELRRRTEHVATRHGKRWTQDDKEEWLALRLEALVRKICLELAAHGEQVILPT